MIFLIDGTKNDLARVQHTKNFHTAFEQCNTEIIFIKCPNLLHKTFMIKVSPIHLLFLLSFELHTFQPKLQNPFKHQFPDIIKPKLIINFVIFTYL